MDNVQYDVESLLTQFDYGNDLQATFTYDSRDRISTLDIKDGATSYLDLDYTLDNTSNFTQIVNGWRDTSSAWHSETESYSYDGLDRLTSASCISWSHTYSYDKVGNRTAKDGITYTINAVNEVTALSDGTSFTYDDNGSRTQKIKGDGTWDYTYDYANRLIKVEKNQTTTGEYIYNGDGRRLQKTENSITTTYIYSGVNVLYEENVNGSAGYIYGLSGRISKRTTINQESNTYYYHIDQLESTRLVTDSDKNIVTASTYHPHGEIDVEEGSENYSYTMKEQDSTGLYYFVGRYYDPSIGRFLTRDSKSGYISHPQTLNRYTYVLNNPLKFVDPDGLECVNILRESSREADENAIHHPEPSMDIITGVIGCIISMIFLVATGILAIVAAGTIAGLVGYLGIVFASIALVWSFVQLYVTLGQGFVDFMYALDWFLEEKGLTRKNITETKYNDDGTVTVFYDVDGTTQSIIFEDTENGWKVVEDTEEEGEEEEEEDSSGDYGSLSGP